jgi:hypothetical protein
VSDRYGQQDAEQCVDVNECAGDPCNQGGDKDATCTHGVGPDGKNQCWHECSCSVYAGFECAAVDGSGRCIACKQVNPCEDNSGRCEHGDCKDDDPTSNYHTCECDQCYEEVPVAKWAPISEAGQPTKCQDINECNAAATAKCKSDGDKAAVCVETTGAEKRFQFVEKMACAGRNEIFMGTKSFLACQEQCFEDDSCVSFEFWHKGHPTQGWNYCQLSSSCTEKEMVPATDGADLYVKEVGCGHHCVCTAGYRLSPDGSSCDEINPCEDHADYCGKSNVKQCNDEAAPSENANCDCDDCYVSSVDNIQFGGRPTCVKQTYCQDLLTNDKLHHCDLGGDTSSTCVESDCKYTCKCSEGYEEINGVCEDINDCIHHKCNGQGVVSAQKDRGTCVDVAAPGRGYTCYCHCGFIYNEVEGTCDSCSASPKLKDGALGWTGLDEDGMPNEPSISDFMAFFQKSSSYVSSAITISNDEAKLFIEIDVGHLSAGIVSAAVNIRPAGEPMITTQGVKKNYAWDGSDCAPEPADFGVAEGRALQVSPKCVTNLMCSEYQFTIPLSDITLSDDSGCSINLMVHVQIQDNNGKIRNLWAVSDEQTEHSHWVNFDASDTCKTAGHFAVTEYTICGLPQCEIAATKPFIQKADDFE